MLTQGSLAKFLWPGVNKAFGLMYDEYDPEWMEIFEQQASNMAFEQDVLVTTTGLPVKKPEGQGITYDDFSQAYVKTYTHVVWALGVIASRESIDDAMMTGGLGKVSMRIAQSLAMSDRQGLEQNAANVLNRAFNAAYTGADGRSLCAENHRAKSGPEWSNESSAHVPLSEGALEDACIAIDAYTNDRGLQMAIMAKKLVVTRQNRFVAERILASMLQNDTGNNAINALKSMNALPDGYCVNHYINGSPSHWFVKTNAPDGFKMMERDGVEVGTDNDFDTENARFKIRRRYDVGWSDPRCVYGVRGAA